MNTAKIYSLDQYCQMDPWRLLDPRNDNLYPALIKDEANYNNESKFIIHKDIVIGMLSRKTYGHFWTIGSNRPLGEADITESSKLAKKVDGSFNTFVLASKAMISDSLPEHIVLKESGPNESGYIYSTKDITEMQSSKHSTFRRYVNKFNKIYGGNISVEIYTDDSDNVSNKEIKELYYGWLEFAGLTEKDMEEETLSFMNYLNLRGTGAYRKPFKIIVRYKGKVVGISVNDIVSDKCAINFYMFSNLNLTGVSSFLFHETNRRLRELGVKELNFQEDLGSEGLRTFKKRLRPMKVYEMVDVSHSLIK